MCYTHSLVLIVLPLIPLTGGLVDAPTSYCGFDELSAILLIFEVFFFLIDGTISFQW